MLLHVIMLFVTQYVRTYVQQNRYKRKLYLFNSTYNLRLLILYLYTYTYNVNTHMYVDVYILIRRYIRTCICIYMYI